MSFGIYDYEKKTMLYGGRAYDHVKKMPIDKIQKALAEYISWDGYIANAGDEPTDASENIEVLQGELDYRMKNNEKKEK